MITGCESPVYKKAKPVPVIGFAHLNAFTVQGGGTDIQQSFVDDARTIAVSREFGMTPAELIKRYANNRFNVTQQPTSLVFDIKTASLKKYQEETDPLAIMTGLTNDIYKMTVLIAMHPVRDGIKKDPFTIYYEQELIISSNTSLADREYRQFEFMEDMITDIDQSVAQIVTTKLN
ncbi:MAG: hypothetical protein AAF988_06895 [Pseudomonadota bacterium]